MAWKHSVIWTSSPVESCRRQQRRHQSSPGSAITPFTASITAVVVAGLVLVAGLPKPARALGWDGGMAPPAVLPATCVPKSPECVEVSTAGELHQAMADDGVLEIVIVVPEIVLSKPAFSPSSVAYIRRDKLIRGSGSSVEEWPTLVNAMGGLPSDTAIELHANLMFVRVRMQGWVSLSETSALKSNEGWADSLLSSPGLQFSQQDFGASWSDWSAEYPGAWMASFGASPTSSTDYYHNGLSAILVQECILDFTPSMMFRNAAAKGSDPFNGILGLFKDLGLSWENDMGEADIFEWPLRTLVFPGHLSVMFWIWKGLRMFNSTLHWEEMAPYQPLLNSDSHGLPPQMECQSTGPEDRGRDYVGNWSSAGLFPETKHECMPWKEVNFLGADFSRIAGNSCRNPGTVHASAFCFRPIRMKGIDKHLPYLEPCDIPKCQSEDALPIREDCQHREDRGNSYNGTLAVSESGKDCMNWVNTIFFQYESSDRNYCRNPLYDNKDGLWCYTGYGYQWEYCDVPMCSTAPSSGFASGTASLDEIMGSLPPGTTNGPDEPSPPPAPDNLSPPGSQSPMVIGLAMAGAFLLATMAGAAILFMQRRRRKASSVVPTTGSASEVQLGILQYMSSAISTYKQAISSDLTSFGDAQTDSRFGAPRISKITRMKEDPVKLGLLVMHEAVGSGYTAQVWRCTWKGSEVACKVLRLGFLSGTVRNVLLQGMEANLVSEFSHPNIIRTFQIYHVCPDLGDSDMASTSSNELLIKNGEEAIAEQLWIVQEFCEGGDLRSAIKDKIFHKGHHEDLANRLKILKQIAVALRYLHDSGIVHGDLKCENVLLTGIDSSVKDFSVKLTDFGLAHALPEGVEYYTSSTVTGDFAYMAPEALMDQKVSAKMDTYSFGLVAYELMTSSTLGRVPTVARHAANLQSGQRPTFPKVFDADMQALFESCWSQLPADRPLDDEVIQKINNLLAKENILNQQKRQEPEGIALIELNDEYNDYLTPGMSSDSLSRTDDYNNYLTPGMSSDSPSRTDD